MDPRRAITFLAAALSQTPGPGPRWDTGIFTTASSQLFVFVQSAGNAFGDASRGGSFPLHCCGPEVLQALKLLPVFAVLTRPSSACECGIFTFDLLGDLVCPHLRCLPWL